ncbi:MAG: metalloregulator ArsR/SmtB family transcription factor [Pseudomonadota bacterium]
MASDIEHPAETDLCLDGVLRALADPDRRAILTTLRTAETLCSALLPDRPRSTVSVHLKVLRAAGLIEQRRQGKAILNSLRSDGAAARYPEIVHAITSADG